MKPTHSRKRTLLFLVLNFIIVFTVYQIFLHLQLLFGTALYLIAAAVMTVAYYVVNRGFGKPITDPDALPAAWSPVEKTKYIDEVTARHGKARKILLWLLPVILTLMIDMTDLFLIQPILDKLG